MKLADLKEGVDYGSPERLLHELKVKASGTQSMGSWIPLENFNLPQWQFDARGGSEGIMQLFQGLEQQGMVELDMQRGAVRVAAEHSDKEDEQRQGMRRTVDSYEKSGRSFTQGT